ncbi:MAG: hypothetical protein LKF34_03660 [Acidaminococcaceae bacterium]|jgi:hypothetical protein|nr:hypothetical protein [Acidaminococcaceae bacterium]
MHRQKRKTAGLVLALLLGSAGLLLPHGAAATEAAVAKTVQAERAAVAASLPQAEKHAPVQFTAVQIIDGVPVTMQGTPVTATSPDQSAFLIQHGANVVLQKMEITKSGDNASGEYTDGGLNAAVLTTDANASLDTCTVTSDGTGASGIFASGMAGKVRAHNTTVSTSGEASRALAAVNGATISANKMTLTTAGKESPALFAFGDDASLLVSDSKITTTGADSPCVYSLGTVSLVTSTATATNSEMAVVEGSNDLTLDAVKLTGGKKYGLLLYASLWEDADPGTAVLAVRNSTLTSTAPAGLFYVTNTKAAVTLENSVLNYSGDVVAQVGAGPWGTPGRNGAIFDLTLTKQQLNGNIVADKLSKVSINLAQGSTWNGTVNTDASAREANVNMHALANWSLSGDAHLNIFTDDDLKLENVASNGYRIYYNAKNKANKWLEGKRYKLSDGGQLVPEPKVK